VVELPGVPFFEQFAFEPLVTSKSDEGEPYGSCSA